MQPERPDPEILQLGAAGVVALVLSLWGGLVHWGQQVRAGTQPTWLDLVIDISTALLAGGVALFFAKAGSVGEWETWAMVSLSAHAGPRALGMWVNKLGRGG